MHRRKKSPVFCVCCQIQQGHRAHRSGLSDALLYLTSTLCPHSRDSVKPESRITSRPAALPPFATRCGPVFHWLLDAPVACGRIRRRESHKATAPRLHCGSCGTLQLARQSMRLMRPADVGRLALLVELLSFRCLVYGGLNRVVQLLRESAFRLHRFPLGDELKCRQHIRSGCDQFGIRR